ncbi:hypothetical protein IPA_05710 [Ignicoccus pacificus DSM 13166]|uniref:Uncharacterized protein n=1 Tax=Ignicoccus pacificus DSM 13166 TaxID=940294 RepID=A0A977KBD1_9CREN|nr:hypothetical protein IPA_05710 [Ignicoccus pacificus DSM 13166]
MFIDVDNFKRHSSIPARNRLGGYRLGRSYTVLRAFSPSVIKILWGILRNDKVKMVTGVFSIVLILYGLIYLLSSILGGVALQVIVKLTVFIIGLFLLFAGIKLLEITRTTLPPSPEEVEEAYREELEELKRYIEELRRK